MSLPKLSLISVKMLTLVAACLLLDSIHAQFNWGEYSASNDVDPKAGELPESWSATRCSKFKGIVPASLKCSDGGICSSTKPCSDGQPCICNDGKKDTIQHLGYTGDGQVRYPEYIYTHLLKHLCNVFPSFANSLFSDLHFCDALPVSSH